MRHVARVKETASVYEGRSPVGRRALAALRIQFQNAGFYAEKERRTESSLRVYPERRGLYPLFLPRFAREDSPFRLTRPSIVCSAYSDGDDAIVRLFQRMPAIANCPFKPSIPMKKFGKYQLHGFFAIPLAFSESSRGRDVDLDTLAPTLAELHLALTRTLFLGSGW